MPELGDQHEGLIPICSINVRRHSLRAADWPVHPSTATRGAVHGAGGIEPPIREPAGRRCVSGPTCDYSWANTPAGDRRPCRWIRGRRGSWSSVPGDRGG